jgi:hypothetical protein
MYHASQPAPDAEDPVNPFRASHRLPSSTANVKSIPVCATNFKAGGGIPGGVQKGGRVQGRLGYRSGYYPRSLITRVGKLELRVPQDRNGRFSSEVYQRSEKALGQGWSPFQLNP